TFGDFFGNFSKNGCYLSLKISYSSFTCVVMNDKLYCLVRQFNLRFFQTMIFKLFLNKEVFSNLEFLIVRVTRESNYFQTISQSWWNSVQNVCCGDKHNIGKIKWNFQIMI